LTDRALAMTDALYTIPVRQPSLNSAFYRVPPAKRKYICNTIQHQTSRHRSALQQLTLLILSGCKLFLVNYTRENAAKFPHFKLAELRRSKNTAFRSSSYASQLTPFVLALCFIWIICYRPIYFTVYVLGCM